MPKVESIINDLQTGKQFTNLPQITHILESDLQRLTDSLKRQRNDKSYYAILRVINYILSEVKRSLGHKDYAAPLFQIGLSQLEGKDYILDLKLKMCQAIVGCQQFHRINFLEHTVNELTLLNLANSLLRARLEIVRAGKEYLKGDYTFASMFYLNAAREEAYVKDEDTKLKLINKAIAFSYVSPRSNESHKNICSLCLTELSKKSHLKPILDKLYMEDMLTKEDCLLMEKQLPQSLGQPDSDGVSILTRSKFLHNMIPIMNSFKAICFDTLSRLLSLPINQILILLEKTYNKGQIKIDQEDQSIEFRAIESDNKARVKQFLNKIDEILSNEKDQ